jgi:hypothetical protein
MSVSNPAPFCPACGNAMPFVRAIPYIDGFQELCVYWCKECAVAQIEGAAADEQHKSPELPLLK